MHNIRKLIFAACVCLKLSNVSGETSQATKTKTYVVPEGPFVLHEHLYNTRTGSVFRVTDKKSNVYALKAFTFSDSSAGGHKERRLFDYANERSALVTVTNASCPDLLTSLSDKTKYGQSITCANHHVQLLLGLDVPVIDPSTSQLVLSRKMRLLNSQGDESERQLDFAANTLIPYMSGGRLNDLVVRVPKYQSMVVRYPLYVEVAPQMVDAVRFMHSLHLVHLGIQASTILCGDASCSDAVLSDPSTSWNGDKSVPSPYATELMQQSVRFSQFVTNTSSSPVTEKLATYLKNIPTDWEGTMKVDWYGLGGALFYVLAGIRPVAEDRSGPNSHDAAEFIYKALQSKQLLSKVPSAEAKEALKNVRDQVAEGLLLVDGLLQTDRSKRISFDVGMSGAENANRAKKNLRNSQTVLMSALQVDRTNERSGSTSCAAFISQSTRESATLSNLPVGDAKTLPAFIQGIC